MRHAQPADLDRLGSLLSELRRLSSLKEKSRGVFYLSGRAFMHFHEHDGAMFADVRFGDDFERFPATTIVQREKLLRRVRGALSAGKPARAR